jgi:hypothetical protein
MESLHYRGKLLIRTICAVLLTSAASMLGLGTTLFADRLQGVEFIRYWSWCFIIALAAIVMALLDMVLIRRASRQERRRIFEKGFPSPGSK